MPDDVLLNKAATIERCLARIQEEYGNNEKNLVENVTKQDSIILNLQRACEASIDLAMHAVRKRELGLPQDRATGVFGGLAQLDQWRVADRLAESVANLHVTPRAVGLDR